MKVLLIMLILVVALIPGFVLADLPDKDSYTFHLKYNSLTMVEAAQIIAALQKIFDDPYCLLEIETGPKNGTNGIPGTTYVDGDKDFVGLLKITIPNIRLTEGDNSLTLSGSVSSGSGTGTLVFTSEENISTDLLNGTTILSGEVTNGDLTFVETLVWQ